MGLSKMNAEKLITEEMAVYRSARNVGDSLTAWQALERAHIVSQPFLGPHLASHWEMLVFAIAERNGQETVGQIVRLALAPLGALTGRIPVGNTGRANVSAFQPMPIAPELKARMD